MLNYLHIISIYYIRLQKILKNTYSYHIDYIKCKHIHTSQSDIMELRNSKDYIFKLSN